MWPKIDYDFMICNQTNNVDNRFTFLWLVAHYFS